MRMCRSRYERRSPSFIKVVMIAVIPAFKPDGKLNNTVSELLALDGFSVVVIDDGSGEEYRELFSRLDERAVVLTHETSLGSGAALKTAFRFIETGDMPDPDGGVVTIDLNGGYTAEDVISVTEKWRENRNALVLGGIRFSSVPPARRFGEGVIRTVFAVSTGVRVRDIYSGLKAFSVSSIEKMLGIAGDGKEYGINQLLYLSKVHTPIIETGLSEIPFDKNSPHRTTFSDAWRICKTVFSFLGSSVISWVVDYTLLLGLNALFKLHIERTGELFTIKDPDPKLPAVVIARIVSSTVNYFLNRRVVFKSGNRLSMLLYFVTVAVLLAFNYLLLDLMTRAGIPLWIAQIMAQIIIYPMSFFLQRKFVFRNKNV